MSRKKGRKEIAAITGTIVLAVILVFVLLWFFNVFSLVFDILIVYGAWWLITGQNIEYEYQCHKRRHRYRSDYSPSENARGWCRSQEARLKQRDQYNPAEFAGRSFDRTVVAAPSETEPGVWYFTYRSKKNGNTLVVFQPDERVMEAFKEALPKLLALEINRKQTQV